MAALTRCVPNRVARPATRADSTLVPADCMGALDSLGSQ
jgi:hypothetical protein